MIGPACYDLDLMIMEEPEVPKWKMDEETQDSKFRELVLKYEQAVNARLETSEKYLALADKYAAALGREAELKEQIRIERSKNRNMVERW